MALVSGEKLGLMFVQPGPKRYAVVREALILTNGWVATDWFDMANYSYAALYFAVVQGSITELQWFVEYSIDGTTWFRQLAEEISLTDIENAEPPNSLPIAGDVNRVKVVPNIGRYVRLQVIAVGTVTASSLEVTLVGV